MYLLINKKLNSNDQLLGTGVSSEMGDSDSRGRVVRAMDCLPS